jgi:hypothetical protein
MPAAPPGPAQVMIQQQAVLGRTISTACDMPIVAFSLPPQPIAATRCMHCVCPKGTDRTGGRQRRARVHGRSIKGLSKVHRRYTLQRTICQRRTAGPLGHGPDQALYGTVSAHQARQKIRDLAATLRHPRRQEHHGTGSKPWKRAVTRTAGSAPAPSAIRPQLSLHRALQRHTMNNPGQEENGPHSRDIPASGPFMQVVAGVGFEPT